MIYQNCIHWRSKKRQGEWAEMRFMAAASAHGFTVMRPWSESVAYDLVLEQAGRFLRIQVKSTGTWWRRNRGRPIYSFYTSRSNGRRYLITDVDFYALYIIAEDLWYIIPPRALCGRRGVSLGPGIPGYRYEQYREAWDLLGEVRDDKDEHGLTLQGCAEEPCTQICRGHSSAFLA